MTGAKGQIAKNTGYDSRLVGRGLDPAVGDFPPDVPYRANAALPYCA